MDYIIRLNSKAFNPITRRVIASRLWEVEQCADRDSEKVLWHCANVKIDGIPINQLFQLPQEGQPPWEMKCSGICVRGNDDSVLILTRKSDVSGH